MALASIFTLFATQTTFAAEVPAGTELAAKQELRWNIGSNPASLDPHKIEGTPEGFTSRQLFETLVISDAEGHIIPGAAIKWEHSPDFKNGHSIFVQTQNGQMVNLSQLKISFSLSNV